MDVLRGGPQGIPETLSLSLTLALTRTLALALTLILTLTLTLTLSLSLTLALTQARRGFGLFYFGLNPNSDDTGGLLEEDWTTPVLTRT